jgi:DNA-binding beta-propeller fold protein YncE
MSALILAIAALAVGAAAAAAETTGYEVCTEAARCKYAPPGESGGEFHLPWSVAAGAGGQVYVADRENNRIQEFDSSGNFIQAWGKNVSTGGGSGFESCTVAGECRPGSPGGLGGEMWLPEGIATDGAGNVWVAEAGNNRLQEFSASGEFLRAMGRNVHSGGGDICTVAAQCAAGEPGGDGGEFNNLFRIDVAANAAGDAFVVGDGRVQKFSPTGAFVVAFGDDVLQDSGTLDPGLEICTNAPDCKPGGGGIPSVYAHVGVDDSGHVYVSDERSNNIIEFDEGGHFLRSWGRDAVTGGGDGAEVCTVEAQCNFYLGPHGSLGGELGEPTGLDGLPGGGVLVSDGGINGFVNVRVQAFSSSGSFLGLWGKDVLAGGGTNNEFCTIAASCQAGTAGGLGGELIHPVDVSVDPSGYAYVADSERIQKFDSSGHFLLMWGKDVVGPPPASEEAKPTAPEPPEEDGNHRPVAKPDAWSLDAGLSLEESVLANDSDPDGDPIAAKVTRISFAHTEWSGLEADGTFLYTAGPGTQKALLKRITYVAVDSHGAESKPVDATIAIVPGSRGSNPLKRGKQRARPATASSSGPYWEGPFSRWAQLCFGSGLHASCYTIDSAAATRELNQDTSWHPDLLTAGKWCLKYGLLPMKKKQCAEKLIEHGLGFIWNRSVLYNAARFGDCLLTRVGRHRSVSHPLSGTWGKAEYAPDDSLVDRFDGNADFTGLGTWLKGGLLSSARWRVPLFCDANGQVWRKVYQDLVTAP